MAVNTDMSQLVAQVEPVIDGILARACRSSEAVRSNVDEVRAEVLTRLWRKLRVDEGEPVERLEDYVATLAHNCVHDFLRARHPQRARLKNRLRLMMSNDDRFAIWTAGGATVCGLSAWRGSAATAEALIPQRDFPAQVFDHARPAAGLLALFATVGAPLPIDALVTLAMDLWSIAEETAVDIEVATVEDIRPTPLASLETRRFLEALWSEVAALPPLQRGALLLNLRDHEGGNALTLFVLLGIAEFDLIAETVGLSAEDLAGLWCELPLDDAAIAARFGLKRQQVINLRKSARERLRRRLQR